MKLQTQFTVPKKDVRDLDYLKKLQTIEKTLKLFGISGKGNQAR